jgi:ribosomal subunit interface protein
VDIIFKGRHTDVQERFRQHASGKLVKIEKLGYRPIRVDVEVSAERNPRLAGQRERVELTIQSRGPVIRAEAAADDRYAALDRAVAKLEERLRRLRDRRRAARHGPAQPGRAPGTRGPAGVASPSPASAAGNGQALDGQAPGWPGAGEAAQAGVVPIPMEGDGPLVVREKYHTSPPLSVDQALLRMELVGHDFYLFRDAGNGLPSVVYRRHGYQYGLIRLVEEPAGAGPAAAAAPAGSAAGSPATGAQAP